MKTSPDLPPNFEAIDAAFNVKGLPIVFTYGDTIYNVPEGYKIAGHLAAHEGVHTEQQGDDPAGWWERYLADPDFRIAQELEAYAIQYNYIRQRYSSSMTKQFLFEIARDLSSSVYGSILTYQEAETRIRQRAKNV